MARIFVTNSVVVVLCQISSPPQLLPRRREVRRCSGGTGGGLGPGVLGPGQRCLPSHERIAGAAELGVVVEEHLGLGARLSRLSLRVRPFSGRGRKCLPQLGGLFQQQAQPLRGDQRCELTTNLMCS